MAGHALVLFAHGARDAQWAEPFRRVVAHIRETAPEVSVELAFLELMRPSLGEAVDGLAAQGVTHVTLVPMFLARGGHLKEDLPRLVDQVRARHPGVAINATEAIGESAAILDALAHWALSRYRADGGE